MRDCRNKGEEPKYSMKERGYAVHVMMWEARCEEKRAQQRVIRNVAEGSPPALAATSLHYVFDEVRTSVRTGESVLRRIVFPALHQYSA